MATKYKYTVFTRVLNREECKVCLDELIAIFIKNRVNEIEMMFGLAWGNHYKDWTPFKVKPDEIEREIERANLSGEGDFFNDETFFTLGDLNTKILFCHEFDVHLCYNEANAVVEDILETWKGKQLIRFERLGGGGNAME